MAAHQRSFSSKFPSYAQEAESIVNMPITSYELRQNGSVFIRVCFIVNILTSISSFLVLMIHILSVLMQCQYNTRDLFHTLAILIVRFFSIFGCAVVIFQEQEITFLIKYFSWLDSWIYRGLFIIFLASLELLLVSNCDPCSIDGLALFFTKIYFLSGLLYSCLGMLCFRQFRQKEVLLIRKKKYMQVQAHILQQQKEEIDKLLEETERRIELA